MSGAIVLVFVLFAIASTLVLWVAIEGETSDPTVVDRSEAERIAKERGGRGKSGADSSEDSPGNANTGSAGVRDEESGWGSRTGDRSATERDERWGNSDDSDRDDRWR